MILNNMKAYIAASLLGKIENNVNNPVPVIHDIENNLVIGFAPISNPASLVNLASFAYGDTSSTNNWKHTIWLGKDGTKENELAVSNYCLNAFSSNELTGGAISGKVSATNNKMSLIVTRTFTAVTDLTVKEIGWIFNLHKGNGNRANVLLIRDVLQTPETYAAGTQFQKSMAFEL